MKNKILLTVTALSLLSSSLFAKGDTELIAKLKLLKPLNTKNVTIEKVELIDSIYLLNIKVRDRRGVKIMPATVTKDMKQVIIGTAYDSKTGDALGLVDMGKYTKDEAFSLGSDTKGGEFFMWTDIDCPACRGLDDILEKENLLQYSTLHVFFYPLERIHPDSKRKSEYILSKPMGERISAYKDIRTGKDKAWQSYSPTQEDITKLVVMQGLGNELSVGGTPTIFDKSGNIVDTAVFVAYLKALKKKNMKKTISKDIK
jgi:protein-disulfide isomerase